MNSTPPGERQGGRVMKIAALVEGRCGAIFGNRGSGQTRSTSSSASSPPRPARTMPCRELPDSLAEVASALAADCEQRPRAQADVFAGQKHDADRLESAPERPGDGRPGRPPLRLEIVDRTRADRSGRCELCDRPAKQGACRTALGGGDHWARACRQSAKAGHCDNDVCFTTPV